MPPLTHTTWTGAQWTTFSAILLALCCAMGLVWLALSAVRTWTTRAPLYRTTAGAQPRPTLALVAQRHARAWATEAGYDSTDEVAAFTAVAGRRLQRALIEETQLIEHPSLRSGRDVADALLPGAGSLVDLRATQSSLATAEPLVDPEVAQWFRDAFDRPPHTPARHEAQEVDLGGVLARWHTAIEPSTRKAHLWALRGEGGRGAAPSARADLAYWRIDTPTGEFAMVPA